MGSIHRFRGDDGRFAWEGVPAEPYEVGEDGRGLRHVLVGPRDGARRFAVRYFEIAPGGRSSLDRHAHDHGVVVLRGRGRVLLGDEVHAIGRGDVVYVEPGEAHRFEADADSPLGFLCVVPPRD